MKKFLIFLAALASLVIVAVGAVILLTPWMDRYGATDAEVAAAFPGDELVPDPASFVNRAITIQASPEEIYPWLVQLDAEKGGWYSYDWLETNLLRCPMTNADRIHPEWQNLQVGDKVRMCPGEAGPPPYVVAQIHPDQAIVLGHQENGEWVDLYQFVIHTTGGRILAPDPAHTHDDGRRAVGSHPSGCVHHGAWHVAGDQGAGGGDGASLVGLRTAPHHGLPHLAAVLFGVTEWQGQAPSSHQHVQSASDSA